MLDRDVLAARIGALNERLQNASGAWGGVTLCAVTKTVDVDTINAAYEAGARVIGENRVQELESKLPALDKRFEIHLIGQLQTNKVKYIARDVSLIQSLDRIALAQEIEKQAAKAGRVMDALVQVNIAREPQKGGLDEDTLIDFLKACEPFEHLRVRGLMAVMPAADDPNDVRPYFRRMRAWFDKLRDHPVGEARMDILSMGMSHDAFVATEEGATMVRIGTAIFGARPPMTPHA